MAYTNVTFANPNTGEIKQAPIGFSWTVLFFGFFVPLFRGDWKWAALMFLAASVTFGLSGFVFMFKYNKLHIKDLVYSGFRATSITKGNIDQVSQELGLNLTAGRVMQEPSSKKPYVPAHHTYGARPDLGDAAMLRQQTADPASRAKPSPGRQASERPQIVGVSAPEINTASPDKNGLLTGEMDDLTFYGIAASCILVIGFATYSMLI